MHAEGVPCGMYKSPHCIEKRDPDEKLSASKVKCPSLLTDFSLSGTNLPPLKRNLLTKIGFVDTI
jgi:hypothetical protein